NVPEDGIYCLNKTLLARKDDLQKFVQASLKGWEYAREHKEETLEVVMRIMKEEHVATNRAHQSWMLDRMLELIEPGAKKVKKGELAESDFHKAQSVLIDDQTLKTRIPFREFYQPVLSE
nr:hypothetical protein [Prolixibacteraceae bacterium]